MISSDDTHHPDDPLDTRLRRQEPGAFEELVADSRTKLWRISLGMLGSHTLAEDALQECYIKAYECLGDGRWDGKSHHAWLRTVLTRIALGKLKRQKRWRTIRAWIRPPTPSLAPPEIDLPAELQRHLDALPVLQRTALILSALDGAKVPDIARTLGKSTGAVEQLLVRARRTLKEHLAHE